ncbi:MAG: PQQ-binding-like beta-propeller repeat protein [Caulobacterales bacterium]
MRRAIVLTLCAALASCSTAAKMGDALNPFNDGAKKKAATAEEKAGRISILTFEQKLAPDEAVASETFILPDPVDVTAWPQPGGPASNAPGAIAGDGDLSVAWKKGAGSGGARRERVTAPPVIADGKIFVLDAKYNVTALSESKGGSIWKRSLQPKKGKDKLSVGGGIAYGDGRIYVATGFGFIAALDAATGKEIWRSKEDAPFSGAPTYDSGKVYASGNDSEIFAMDAATGEELWTYQAIAEPARVLSASSAAVDGDLVVAPFPSGEIVGLNAGNGQRLWSDALTRAGQLTSLASINDIAGRPVISNGMIFAMSQSGLIAAIDERSGQRIWTRPLASIQTPLVVGEYVFAVSVDGEVVSMKRDTGAIRWVKQLTRYTNVKKKKGRIVWAGPLMVGGQLVLASSEGKVNILDPGTGDVKKTLKIGNSVTVPPIAANQTVYLLNENADLIALR